MKLLIISPFLPGPIDSGGKCRLYNLLRVISPELKICYLWLTDGPTSPAARSDLAYNRKEFSQIEFLDINVKINFLKKIIFCLAELSGGDKFIFRALKRRIKEIIRTQKPDIVQVEFSQSARYCPRMATPSLLVVHEIVSQRIRRQLKTARTRKGRIGFYFFWLLFRRRERNAFKKFNRLIVVSDEDKKILRAGGLNEAKISVVPNGVDLKTFHNPGEIAASQKIYFLGWFKNEQNVDALRYFFSDLLPPLRARNLIFYFTVIGRDLPADLLALIKKNNFSYQEYLTTTDLAKTLANRLLIVPLRFGGGTRLKILEALALGNPVLSTPLGAEGLEFEPGKDILIFNQAEDFARLVQRLWQNPADWLSLGRAGQKLATAKYSWEIIGRDLLKIYRALTLTN